LDKVLSVTLAPRIAAPVLSVTVPLKDVEPVCPHAQVTAKRNAREEIRRFCFTIEIEHFMDCSFRAPLPIIDLYAGGQHQTDAKKDCGSSPGLNLEKNSTFGNLPHHSSNG
jgi:hypothetical protein